MTRHRAALPAPAVLGRVRSASSSEPRSARSASAGAARTTIVVDPILIAHLGGSGPGALRSTPGLPSAFRARTQHQIGSDPSFGQHPPHGRRVAPTTLRQRARMIVEVRIVPRRLRVADEGQCPSLALHRQPLGSSAAVGTHCPSRSRFVSRRRRSATTTARNSCGSRCRGGAGAVLAATCRASSVASWRAGIAEEARVPLDEVPTRGDELVGESAELQ